MMMWLRILIKMGIWLLNPMTEMAYVYSYPAGYWTTVMFGGLDTPSTSSTPAIKSHWSFDMDTRFNINGAKILLKMASEMWDANESTPSEIMTKLRDAKLHIDAAIDEMTRNGSD